jgi:hypothetical protein
MNYIIITITAILICIVLIVLIRMINGYFPIKLCITLLGLLFIFQGELAEFEICQYHERKFVELVEYSNNAAISENLKIEWNQWLENAQLKLKEKGNWSFYSYSILKYKKIK